MDTVFLAQFLEQDFLQLLQLTWNSKCITIVSWKCIQLNRNNWIEYWVWNKEVVWSALIATMSEISSIQSEGAHNLFDIELPLKIKWIKRFYSQLSLYLNYLMWICLDCMFSLWFFLSIRNVILALIIISMTAIGDLNLLFLFTDMQEFITKKKSLIYCHCSTLVA